MQETRQIELQRIPGLFRLWELGQVLEPEVDYHIEDAGKTDDGAQLVAVYRSTARDEGEG